MVAMTAQNNEIVEMLGFMGLAISTALAVAFFRLSPPVHFTNWQ
jgi:hypothetical protein